MRSFRISSLQIGKIIEQEAMDKLIMSSNTLQEMACASIFEKSLCMQRECLALPQPEAQEGILSDGSQSSKPSDTLPFEYSTKRCKKGSAEHANNDSSRP